MTKQFFTSCRVIRGSSHEKNNLTLSPQYLADTVPPWVDTATTRQTCTELNDCAHATKGAGAVMTRGAHTGANPAMFGQSGHASTINRALLTSGQAVAQMRSIWCEGVKHENN